MTTQTDYTPAEWDLLVGMPALIARVMMCIEPCSPDTANSRVQPTLAAIMDLEPLGARSALIESVIGALQAGHGSSWATMPLPELLNLRHWALDTCYRAAAILAQKAPEADADAYSSWLLAIGHQVMLVSAYQPLPVDILKTRANRQRVVLDELAAALTVRVAADGMCTSAGFWLPPLV